MLSAQKKTEAGFSLLEILLTITLLVVIASLGLFLSLESYHSNSFASERLVAISALQKARSQAMSNICLGSCSGNNSLKHGVHFNSSLGKYIIFQGASFDDTPADAAVDQAVPINSSVSFSGATDIIFNQLDGSSSGGSVTIVDNSTGKSTTININTEGGISWN